MPFDIYSNITSSIRPHKRVQVATIIWRQAGEGGETSFWRSLPTRIGTLFLLPFLKSFPGFSFAPSSSSNFLAVHVQHWNPVNVFFHPQLLTWIPYVYDFEVKWVLELQSIRERSQAPGHKVAYILNNCECFCGFLKGY